jgi:hypothetical protein
MWKKKRSMQRTEVQVHTAHLVWNETKTEGGDYLKGQM